MLENIIGQFQILRSHGRSLQKFRKMPQLLGVSCQACLHCLLMPHGILFPHASLLSCPFPAIWAPECLIHIYGAKRSTRSARETMNSHGATQSMLAEARDWDRDSEACDKKAPSSGEWPTSSRLNCCFTNNVYQRMANIQTIHMLYINTSSLVHFLPSEPRNVWFTSMEQRGQQGLHVKQWIPMEQHKACSLKLETGIATPKLAIRKHHPLANDLQAQDSTAASRTTSIKEWRTSKQYTCYI